MTHISPHGRAPVPQMNPVAGLAGMALFIVVLVGVATVFEASAAAGFTVLAAVVFSIAFAIAVEKEAPMATVLSLGGAAWAAGSSFVVFDQHFLSFTAASAIFDVLFAAALIAGGWAALSAVFKALAGLFAAAAVVATVVLPRPPGGEGALDTAEQWRVEISARDQYGNALGSARVMCGAVLMWNEELALSEALWKDTDANGHYTWEFDEDPRLKSVICTVWKDADNGNAGYPAQSQFIYSFTGGGDYDLSYQLSENAHPDTAFVAVDADPEATVSVTLWAGVPPPLGQPAAPGVDVVGYGYNYSEIKGGFTVGADKAGGDLYLEYVYRAGGDAGAGASGADNQVRVTHIGPVALGTHVHAVLSPAASDITRPSDGSPAAAAGDASAPAGADDATTTQ